MVTAQLPVSQVDDIVARARQVSFGRFLLTFILAIFWAMGWTAGSLWTGVVMIAITIRRGWLDARGAPGPVHAMSRE
jgi:uncharacterized membrane protein YciS (DUF1049 family)